MTNYQDLIGSFKTSKDGKKFIVQAYLGKKNSSHRYLIKFLGTTTTKEVNRQDILSNKVSSRIIKTKNSFIPTKSKKKSNSVSNMVPGIGLRMLTVDCATKISGYAIFNQTNLVDFGEWKNDNKKLEKRIRHMCKKFEECILEYNINYVNIEDVFYESGKFKTFIALLKLQGALIDTCERLEVEHNMKIIQDETLAQVWKSGLNILSERVTGKNLAIQYVQKELSRKVSEDAAEAICIGLYCMKYKIDWSCSW